MSNRIRPMGTVTALAPDPALGRSVQPGRSLPASDRGDTLCPIRNRIGDRHRRSRSGAYSRELLVVTGLPGGDCGKAPYVEEPPRPLVTHRVVRGIDRLVVLPEELRVLSFGEVS